MKKNIIKLTGSMLLILLLIFAFIGIFFLSNELSTKSSKNKLQFEEFHLFYTGKPIKVSVNNSKKIIIEQIISDSILIASGNKAKFYVNFNKNFNKNAIELTIESQKVFVLSDVEGNFNVFYQFLIINKVIDKNLNWIFGDGQLVCNGDFFDRGDDVTACLWLIYKLEQEAEKQGGKVHYIIGNHEEMNLRGINESTHPKYIALSNELKIPYKELYGKDTELGRWLRTKNSVIKINDVLFTHGGISPELIEKKYSLEEINQLTQKYIGEDKDYLKFINPRASFIFDRQGPMWYRGYFGDYKEYYKGTSQKDIDNILNYYEANHIVVGHTIVDKVQTLFNNKVIAIDAMSENDPRKQDDDNMAVSCEGLYIENNHFYRVLFNGKKELLFKK